MNDIDCLKEYCPITLEDQELINHYLALTDYRLSRYNFLNLWMYQKWLPVHYYQKDDILLLSTFYKHHYFSYMPLCKKEKLKEAFTLVESLYSECGLPFIYAGFENDIADMILDRHPDFEKKAYPSSFDYIYDIKRFQNFSGKKLQKKRNHLNAFYNNYPDFVYQNINEGNLNEIKKFCEKWYSKHEGTFLEHDKEANFSVLDAFFKLNVKGGCLLINGEIKAFIITSLQNNDTMQVNIEKADESYRGIYQALLKEFLRDNYLEAKFMNREDDLGLENLRKAKRSYYPEIILENYRICQKDHHADYQGEI